jgi:hypothetical protein
MIACRPVSNRRNFPRAAALAAVLLPCLAHAQDANRFDGKWTTTVTCKNVKNPGGPVRFTTEVIDGVLAGQFGADDAPGFLRIDGKVTPAGVGHIYANGRTGAAESVAGRDIPAGSEYKYYVQAKFEGKAGSGNRVEGRACAFKFEKK